MNISSSVDALSQCIIIYLTLQFFLCHCFLTNLSTKKIEFYWKGSGMMNKTKMLWPFSSEHQPAGYRKVGGRWQLVKEKEMFEEMFEWLNRGVQYLKMFSNYRRNYQHKQSQYYITFFLINEQFVTLFLITDIIFVRFQEMSVERPRFVRIIVQPGVYIYIYIYISKPGGLCV